MSGLRASRLHRLLWLLCALLLALIGFVPLFAGPSYEFSLACGLLLPLLGAPFNAVWAARQRALPEAAFFAGLGSGLVLCGIALCVAIVHGARIGFCDPLGDFAFFLIGPLPGALLGATWGAVSGAFIGAVEHKWRRTVLAIAVALSAPLLGIVFSVARYYQSPMIFAFDQFVGFFSGTPYDTIIDGTERLVSYRVATMGWLLVLWTISGIVVRNAEGGFAFRLVERRRLAALGAFGLLLALGITLFGNELGHYQTVASTRQALGHVAQAERCEIVYASGISQRDAHALARECDAHVAQQARYFEVEAPERITVYLFASSTQKAWLMGARDVYIAKPWRNEVYLQARSTPHPVLGHELAHVMAGQFATGPFEVAGPAGGWIPDPGRIEGVAVAASPRQGDDLTLLQWARAMHDKKLLPPLSGIFKLSFIGQNSSKAYTVAGAFIHWLREAHGVSAVKAWYGGATLEDATGKSLQALEQDFLTHLESVTVSEQAQAVAEARFDRPAVFGRRCPHQVDALVSAAGSALSRLDPVLAKEHYDEVLEMDPHNFAARVGEGRCAFRQGESKEARQVYERLLGDDSLSALQRAWLQERLGDLAFYDGHFKTAATRYTEAKQFVVDQDSLRTLDVKLSVAKQVKHGDLARRAVGALLVGEPLFGTDWSVAASALGSWAEADAQDGLAEYLIGRNLSSRGRWAQAAEYLDAALSQGVSLDLVKAEALRTRLHLACALGQHQVAESAIEHYLEEKTTSEARRLSVARFAERCGVGPNRAAPSEPEPAEPKQAEPRPGAVEN